MTTVGIFGTTHLKDTVITSRMPKRRTRAKQHVGWLKFESQFKTHHPEFIHKLAKKYPALTPAELHICAMLRASLFSWEIAEELSITERSVENHRSNIRKKLGLHPDQNLQVFLTAFH